MQVLTNRAMDGLLEKPHVIEQAPGDDLKPEETEVVGGDELKVEVVTTSIVAVAKDGFACPFFMAGEWNCYIKYKTASDANKVMYSVKRGGRGKRAKTIMREKLPVGGSYACPFFGDLREHELEKCYLLSDRARLFQCQTCIFFAEGTCRRYGFINGKPHGCPDYTCGPQEIKGVRVGWLSRNPELMRNMQLLMDEHEWDVSAFRRALVKITEPEAEEDESE